MRVCVCVCLRVCLRVCVRAFWADFRVRVISRLVTGCLSRMFLFFPEILDLKEQKKFSIFFPLSTNSLFESWISRISVNTSASPRPPWCTRQKLSKVNARLHQSCKMTSSWLVQISTLHTMSPHPPCYMLRDAQIWRAWFSRQYNRAPAPAWRPRAVCVCVCVCVRERKSSRQYNRAPAPA